MISKFELALLQLEAKMEVMGIVGDFQRAFEEPEVPAVEEVDDGPG